MKLQTIAFTVRNVAASSSGVQLEKITEKRHLLVEPFVTSVKALHSNIPIERRPRNLQRLADVVDLRTFVGVGLLGEHDSGFVGSTLRPPTVPTTSTRGIHRNVSVLAIPASQRDRPESSC